ncbi:MAG: hypothetical protein ACRD63_00585 [Pyrinomonadaceae bacterium]
MKTEVNRFSTVKSLSGRINIDFLDNSFAKCGIAEKYRSADGRIVVQRPSKIYLEIQAPFIGTPIARMTSDGDHFRVAVLAGDEKYKRFVMGTNLAVYPRLETDAQITETDCGDNMQDPGSNKQKRTVNAISGLRPQHLTDAFLIKPLFAEGSKIVYSRTETFEEEPDTRPGAKNNARVVRGYYLLDEITVEALEAKLIRRFWFDRVGGLRLARMQTFNGNGELITDVRYSSVMNIGEDTKTQMPTQIEITRPQDRYSLRMTFQSSNEITIDKEYPNDIFVLQNKWNLPEVDLDK